MARLKLVTLFVSWVTLLARGEVYELKDAVLPVAKSLQVIHAFYVLRPDEVSIEPTEDPVDHVKPPYVKFDSMQPNVTLQGMKGIELSLVTPARLQELVKGRILCSSESRLLDVTVATEVKVDGKPNTDVTPKPLEGGMYYLVISNCGDSSRKGAVSGSVAVKNPYGFLPGDQFFKKQFYGWFSVAYAFLTFAWVAMIVRYYLDAARIHICILIVLATGLAQMLTTYYTLSDLNASGYSKHFLACSSAMLSVSKSGVAYMVLMAVCSGWGATSEEIDGPLKLKLHLVSVLFIPVTYFAQSVLRFRHTQRFAESLMFGCVAAVVLANAVVLMWTFSCLGEFSKKLRQQNLQKSIAQFDYVWKILFVFTTLSVGPVVAQVLDIMQREQLSMWQHQWFFQEGVSDIVFLLVLILMMSAWSPDKDVLDFQFSAEHGTKEEGAPIVWADDETLEEEDDGGYGVKPNTYGSRRSGLDE